VRVRSGPANRSYSDDEDLDYESSAELAKITEPLKLQAVAKHLELMWKISQVQHESYLAKIWRCNVLAKVSYGAEDVMRSFPAYTEIGQWTFGLLLSRLGAALLLATAAMVLERQNAVGATEQVLWDNIAMHGYGQQYPFVVKVLVCCGAGVLTVGDEIYCNETTGCRPCPICNHQVCSPSFAGALMWHSRMVHALLFSFYWWVVDTSFLWLSASPLCTTQCWARILNFGLANIIQSITAGSKGIVAV
jgi:hypothetical protein